MDGHVCGLMRTRAMVQSSQNATHLGENPSTHAGDTICRARPKRKTQDPLQNSLGISGWQSQNIKPSVGFSKARLDERLHGLWAQEASPAYNSPSLGGPWA